MYVCLDSNVFHDIVYLFPPDTWYVMKTGSDKDGCGRTPGSACSTLLYLLQQVNRTHLPPSTAIKISTEKCLNIDQQAAVSTIICPAFYKILFELGFVKVCLCFVFMIRNAICLIISRPGVVGGDTLPNVFLNVSFKSVNTSAKPDMIKLCGLN